MSPQWSAMAHGGDDGYGKVVAGGDLRDSTEGDVRSIAIASQARTRKTFITSTIVRRFPPFFRDSLTWNGLNKSSEC